MSCLAKATVSVYTCTSFCNLIVTQADSLFKQTFPESGSDRAWTCNRIRGQTLFTTRPALRWCCSAMQELYEQDRQLTLIVYFSFCFPKICSVYRKEYSLASQKKRCTNCILSFMIHLPVKQHQMSPIIDLSIIWFLERKKSKNNHFGTDGFSKKWLIYGFPFA